jgi:ubiquinone/menaquinone biosynthesis C-methylase UbiE
VTDFLRDALRTIWSTAAPAWGRHADYVDSRGAQLTQVMLDAADVRPGVRVLELACGPGGTGLAAAERVAPDGEVVLSDVAAEMTAIAAERADARNLRNVKTVQVGMEDVGFPDASFDAVVCREGLMLVLDPAAAVREAHRVLVPGGRAVFAVWGLRERNPWLGVLLDAITSRLGIPVPPPGMPDPFALSHYGELEKLLSEAGFHDVSVAELATPMNVSSFDEWWSVVPSLAGPVGPILDAQPPDVSAAIRGEANAALDEFRTDTGYHLPGLSFVGVGSH